MLISALSGISCAVKCRPILLLIAALTLFGPFARTTEASAGTQASMPVLGRGSKLEPGITMHEVTLRSRNGSSRIWIYLPEEPTGRKLPCVLIAPAGSRLFHGMSLGQGSVAEHLPYVRAGFVVVAYDIDGDTSRQP